MNAVAVSAAVLGLTGALAFASGATASTEAEPAAAAKVASTPDPANWAGTLSLLSTAATEADATPIGTTELFDASTSRVVSSTADATYWAALNNSGELCLVAAVASDEPNPYVGVTCGSPSLFSKHGIGIQVVTKATAVRAYLVPDKLQAAKIPLSITTDTERSAPTDNIVHVDPYAPAALATQRLTTSQAGKSSAVELLPFETPDPSELG